MSVYAVYFSPTGGTAKVCKAVAAALGEAVKAIDRTDFDSRWQGVSFGRDDIVVLGMPVYGGRLPMITHEFFRGMEAFDTPVVLVCTFGNRAHDNALYELFQRATECGFAPVAAGAFVAPHSLDKNIAGSRPDASDLDVAAKLAATARQRIEGEIRLDTSALPFTGEMPPGSDPQKAPVCDPALCASCRVCAGACPVRAINPDEPTYTDARICLFCQRCVRVCPGGARKIGDLPTLSFLPLLRAMTMQRRDVEVY